MSSFFLLLVLCPEPLLSYVPFLHCWQTAYGQGPTLENLQKVIFHTTLPTGMDFLLFLGWKERKGTWSQLHTLQTLSFNAP
jgi:hypothetical protein